MSRRVVLAMSGGVDSSVAAYLLKEEGYDVIGLFMRTGAHAETPERRQRTCCSVADSLDARAVADRLDIPFYALDFEQDFNRIQDNFADEYLAGRTPNPCVLCNIWLKFGKLWDYGRQVGADFVATGHYAQITQAGDGTRRVARAVDRDKDQSYVLFGLTSEVLRSALLPVGGYTKAAIRAIALERGLPVHDKPDSQEICFIPDHDVRAFVRGRRPETDTSGPVLDEKGQVIATHKGLEGFTIGQRKSLGVPATGQPRYVVEIEPTQRTVRVGPRAELEKHGLEASRMNWQGPLPTSPLPCLAQIRARHRAVPAWVEPLPDHRARVLFQKPEPAIAPGQIVALYQNDMILGGGWIDRALTDIEVNERLPQTQTQHTSTEPNTW